MLIETAHDVRNLVQCSRCRKLGDKREMLGPFRRGGIYHGRCYIAIHGVVTTLLTVSAAGIGRLTLDDVGVDVMRILVRYRRTGKLPDDTL